MNEEEKKALEQLKYMNEDGCEKCVYGEDKTCINCWEAHKEIILNLIEKQDKMINEMASEIAQFRNMFNFVNDTKEAVIEEYNIF
jgi:hypothetical protein